MGCEWTRSRKTTISVVLLFSKGEKISRYIVDCDIDPKPYFDRQFLWVSQRHVKGGLIEFDAAKIQLYVSPNIQVWHSPIDGSEHRLITFEKLERELTGKKVLNANFLDFFLEHPDLIPEKWKGLVVCFWGTLYGTPPDNFYGECIRTLIWWPATKKWRSSTKSPASLFDPKMPAAILIE